MGMGNNDEGQLGLGDTLNRSDFTKIPYIKAKFAAGEERHSILIDMGDNALGCGLNRSGQLGPFLDKNAMNHLYPSQIGMKAKFAACGSDHTAIIDLEDKVVLFGNNVYSQLGFSPLNSSDQVFKIEDINVQYIACGADYTVVIDSEDGIWTTGDDTHGQLGRGGSISSDNTKQLGKIPGLKGKIAACGYTHTLIIDEKDNVYSFGLDIFGKLGHKPSTSVPTLIPKLKGKSMAVAKNLSIVLGTYQK